MRVVFDTNVYVSALVFGGVPRQAITLVLERQQLVVSPALLHELTTVFARKFHTFQPDHRALAVIIEEASLEVETGALSLTVCRDPKDNMILETAVLGSADYVVTGDQDLLVLNDFQGITICTPAQFIARQ